MATMIYRWMSAPGVTDNDRSSSPWLRSGKRVSGEVARPRQAATGIQREFERRAGRSFSAGGRSRPNWVVSTALAEDLIACLLRSRDTRSRRAWVPGGKVPVAVFCDRRGARWALVR